MTESEALARIDAVAEIFEIELFAWQRDLAATVLRGERVYIGRGRRIGLATVRRVVEAARNSPDSRTSGHAESPIP